MPVGDNKFVKTDGGLKKSRFKSKKKRGDCVVRSIAIALNKSYEEIFDELADISKETGFFHNAPETYERLLAKYNYYKNKPQRYPGSSTAVQLLDFNSKGRTTLVHVYKHLTVIKDNAVNDLWDCRTYTAQCYYQQKELH